MLNKVDQRINKPSFHLHRLNSVLRFEHNIHMRCCKLQGFQRERERENRLTANIQKLHISSPTKASFVDCVCKTYQRFYSDTCSEQSRLSNNNHEVCILVLPGKETVYIR